MLKYAEIALSYREVPNEISLCIYLSGCKQNCENCHYLELKQIDYGEWLHLHYTDIIDLYLTQATCVCFLGEGQGSKAEIEELSQYAVYANKLGLKTGLYCGRDAIIEPWMERFDYLKLGSYQPNFGPLDAPSTNQRMYRKSENGYIDITSMFWE